MVRHWSLGLSIMAVVALALVILTSSRLAPFLKTPGAEAIAPLQGLAGAVMQPVATLLDALGQVGSLSQENEDLRRHLGELEAESVRLQEAGEENKQLRALLNYERDNPGREYLPANVIGYDPNSFIRSVVIDKGSNNGLQVGMVVVTAEGMVGKVLRVQPRVATVLLLSDPSAVVNAVDQRSRVQGVLTGHPDSNLTLHYVEKDSDVRVGDKLVTSGLGGGYPKGILLGTVTEVKTQDQAGFKEVRVTPAARLRNVSLTLVIADFTPIELP